MEKIIWGYLVFMNFAAFWLFGLDKRRAIRQRWRISERTLLGAAVLGGSPGAFLGMQVFHHKTKHKKFSLGIPAIFLAQVLLLWGIGRAFA